MTHVKNFSTSSQSYLLDLHRYENIDSHMV